MSGSTPSVFHDDLSVVLSLVLLFSSADSMGRNVQLAMSFLRGHQVGFVAEPGQYVVERAPPVVPEEGGGSGQDETTQEENRQISGQTEGKHPA